ncbi:MAG: hypothetical protein ACRESS_12430 [Stenotrophobium sp.]
MTPNTDDWANAVALRISDEWSGTAQDKAILLDALAEAFKSAPHACARLIGTQVIEENYFESLS